MKDSSKFMVLLAVISVVALICIGVKTVWPVDPEEPVEVVPYVAYYDQLDPNGQVVYEAFEGLTAETVSKPFKVTLAMPLYTDGSDAEKAGDYLDSAVQSAVNDAFYATSLVDPMAFWTWGTGIYAWSYEKVASGGLTGVTEVTVTVTMDPFYADDPSTAVNELQSKIDALGAAVEKFETKETTPKGIVSAANKYIVDNVTYDTLKTETPLSPCAHDAYGALVGVNGKKLAVCDGFSEAFRLLCAKYGVDAVMILGTTAGVGHAWNAVEIDGEWYGVDTTWNKNSGSAYLLIGQKSVGPDGLMFSQSHSAGLDVYFTNGHMSYPTLAAHNYEYKTPTWFDIYGVWLLALVMVDAILIIIFRLARQDQ